MFLYHLKKAGTIFFIKKLKEVSSCFKMFLLLLSTSLCYVQLELLYYYLTTYSFLDALTGESDYNYTSSESEESVDEGIVNVYF